MEVMELSSRQLASSSSWMSGSHLGQLLLLSAFLRLVSAVNCPKVPNSFTEAEKSHFLEQYFPSSPAYTVKIGPVTYILVLFIHNLQNYIQTLCQYIEISIYCNKYVL
jgi:hypothetical protein